MNPVTSLSLGRIAVGVASLAKPDLVTSTLTGKSGPGLLTQWFGTREIAIGAATLLASGGSRRTLVLIGIAVDAADAATAYAAIEAEEIPKNLGYAAAGIAGFAVVSGLLGLRVKKKTVVAVA